MTTNKETTVRFMAFMFLVGVLAGLVAMYFIIILAQKEVDSLRPEVILPEEITTVKGGESLFIEKVTYSKDSIKSIHIGFKH